MESTGLAPTQDHREGSLGLPQLRQRLALRHGPRAQVELTPLPEGGGRLSLSLPWSGDSEVSA